MRLLLYILLINSVICPAQAQHLDSLEAFYTIAPTPLNFKDRQINTTILQAKTNVSSAIKFNNDSLFVYAGAYGRLNLSFGIKNQYKTTSITIKEITATKPPNIYFDFDSLNTSSLYLIARWQEKLAVTSSTYSGNEELLCNQTQTTFSEKTTGIIIISLNTMSIIYQGVSSKSNEVSEKKYPGSGKKRITENKMTENLRFNQKGGYIHLFDSKTSWQNNDTIPRGTYIVRDNKFVLIKKG